MAMFPYLFCWFLWLFSLLGDRGELDFPLIFESNLLLQWQWVSAAVFYIFYTVQQFSDSFCPRRWLWDL